MIKTTTLAGVEIWISGKSRTNSTTSCVNAYPIGSGHHDGSNTLSYNTEMQPKKCYWILQHLGSEALG